MSDKRYSEGVCGDGAAILRDGNPMRVDEIISRLNELEAGQQSAVEAMRERCARICDPYTHGQWFAKRIRALPAEDSE